MAKAEREARNAAGSGGDDEPGDLARRVRDLERRVQRTEERQVDLVRTLAQFTGFESAELKRFLSP